MGNTGGGSMSMRPKSDKRKHSEVIVHILMILLSFDRS